jgi:hypothetical protein
MSIYPEIPSELNRKRIKEEMDAIRLEEEAVKGKTLLDKSLALLGKLMISGGEKLRNRHHASQETSSVKLINKVA